MSIIRTKFGFSLKTRLASVVSCMVTIVVLGIVFINVNRMIEIQKEMALSQNIASRFSRLTTFVVDMETGERGFMLSGDTAYLEPYNQAEEQFEKYVRETKTFLKDHKALFKVLDHISELKKQWIEGPAVKEMLARRRLDRGLITHKDFIDIFKASNGKVLTDEIRSEVDKTINEQNLKIEALRKTSEENAKSVMMWAGVVILTVLIGFGSTIGVANSVHNSISSLISRLENISVDVSSTASSTSEASQKLSICNMEQAKSLETTASSLDEITAMMVKNVDNARFSIEVSEKSQKAAALGKKSVNEMMLTIQDINSSNEIINSEMSNSNKQIEDIVQVIMEIKNKTKVINEIVFQTRLLSFNASVEAARAGEHGKGFAVVAEEVGNLAQMSGKAAQEISELIENSAQRVETIVESTKESMARLVAEGRQKISNGTKVVNKCDESLEEIVLNVKSVGQVIHEIASASTEQAQGIKEINQAVGQLDSSGQNNVMISKETALYAQKMLSQAEALQDIVYHLQTTLDGQKKSDSETISEVEEFNQEKSESDDEKFPEFHV